MRTLSIPIVTYLIEYLGEFEFIYETILYYESGDQMGYFDAKKPPSKISCLGTFKRYYYNRKHFCKMYICPSGMLEVTMLIDDPRWRYPHLVEHNHSLVHVLAKKSFFAGSENFDLKLLALLDFSQHPQPFES
jgi:hypothetical protein